MTDWWRKYARMKSLTMRKLRLQQTFFQNTLQKYIRLKRVVEGAGLFAQSNPPLLKAAETGADQDNPEQQRAETSDDWINKFREDASLVDSDLVREIYSRILAQEARTPKAFSLPTLGVLRYLDMEVAQAFGRLQNAMITRSGVPKRRKTGDVLDACGLSHTDMVMLDDAGLVNSSISTLLSIKGQKEGFLELTAHQRIVRIRRPDGSDLHNAFDVLLLTPAGVELAKIADCEPKKEVFEALINWIQTSAPGLELTIAKLPSRDWDGDPTTLVWELNPPLEYP